MPMNINPKKIVSMIIASKKSPEDSNPVSQESSDKPESDVSLAGRDAVKRFAEALEAKDFNKAWEAFVSMDEICDSKQEESEENSDMESEENSKGMEY